MKAFVNHSLIGKSLEMPVFFDVAVWRHEFIIFVPINAETHAVPIIMRILLVVGVD